MYCLVGSSALVVKGGDSCQKVASLNPGASYWKNIFVVITALFDWKDIKKLDEFVGKFVLIKPGINKDSRLDGIDSLFKKLLNIELLGFSKLSLLLDDEFVWLLLELIWDINVEDSVIDTSGWLIMISVILFKLLKLF